MLTIGLTGGFGTGKTTVAKMFAKLGAKIIDADKINHALIHKGGACFKNVVRSFGKGILSRGDLDRDKLGVVVFNDPGKLQKLCRLAHPAIIREVKRRISTYKRNKNHFLIIVDAPLLIETGLEEICDILVVVKASREVQVRRLKRRMPIEEKDIKKRIRAQMPLREKTRLADIVIDNNGTLTKTKKEVKEIWQKLLKKK